MNRISELPDTAAAGAVVATAFNLKGTSMKTLYDSVKRFVRDESGANGVEYALLVDEQQAPLGWIDRGHLDGFADPLQLGRPLLRHRQRPARRLDGVGAGRDLAAGGQRHDPGGRVHAVAPVAGAVPHRSRLVHADANLQLAEPGFVRERLLDGDTAQARETLLESVAQLNALIQEIRAYIFDLRLHEPNEQGVVLRFGEWIKTTQPGLNWHFPAPIETALTPKVTRVNRVEVGFISPSEAGRSGGSRVYAPLDGQVVFSGTKAGYGNLIILIHRTPPGTSAAGDGPVSTAYAHLEQRGVAEGVCVSAGQQIGVVGATFVGPGGRTGGVRPGMPPHLHFSVFLNNTAVDPALFLAT